MEKTKINNKAGKQKGEKRARTGIVVLMCLVTLCLAGTVGVSTFTDIFKQESEVKAVALVLTQAEEQELEKQDRSQLNVTLFHSLPREDSALSVHPQDRSYTGSPPRKGGPHGSQVTCQYLEKRQRN